MKNTYTMKKKKGDYIIYCQICGDPCWASQATKLEKETGHGGLIVCPEDVDAIDYGLIPFKIAPEENPKIVTINHYASNPNDVPNSIPPIDLSLINPMNSNDPRTTVSLGQTWEELADQTWENWALPWGQ